MSVALLFAGQGAQSRGTAPSRGLGTAAALTAACPDCAATLERAGMAAGFDLLGVVRGGSFDDLRATTVAQPALVALGVAEARHLETLGVRPAMLAGHSVGQYAALVVAGALDLRDAVCLVTTRGRLMQETVADGSAAMVTIVGLDACAVADACAKAQGVVGVACLNAPERVVISGEAAAVEAAAALCEEEGGGVLPLEVSVPFHSELLAPMLPAFRAALAEISFREPKLPVVDNVTAEVLSDPRAIREALLRHVVAPVRFDESLRAMGAAGVERFIHCGPGAALLGFAKRAVPSAARASFEELFEARERGAVEAHAT